MTNNPNKKTITDWFKGLQDRICEGLEQLDGQATFHQDLWQHIEGGGGRTRIIQGGDLIEKGGVNFSGIHGHLSPKMSEHLQLDLNAAFYATGVSIVLHPKNPYMPIIHKNIRYFEVEDGSTYWFGGGIDLTPHYVQVADAQFFHQSLKETCDAADPAYYPDFKAYADRYFFIPHRKETRGVGGIFFDHLKADETHTKADRWAFLQGVGESFLPIYTFFANKYRQQKYGEREKKWQMLRRSRYVEFNLVYDRGTKFGLSSKGRIESILMSMPPVAHWDYNVQPKADSAEAFTLRHLRQGIDWLNLT